MAKVTLGGRDFEIAPYKLGQLRAAAPIIDRINASIPKLTDTKVPPTMSDMAASLTDTLAVLYIGIAKADPTVTLEVLEDLVGIGDQAAVLSAFREVMQESGLGKGEALAPPLVASEGASETV
jgi:hypothetical protein